mmetsp:Transcript_14420/g.36388  ORF Transcript_14420/g.36388 Transcript_14420/m.36388 type:complete len:193 (-) Transcript_14420:105-683(-)
MNFQNIPVKNPTTHASHIGPGSQHGKPYYPHGQECYKVSVPGPSARAPLDVRGTARWQTRPNNRYEERTLHVFGDPPTHRSCVASHNKDGGLMDSQSHYLKVGSKHMCDPRPDHSFSMHRSMSLPDRHPWEARRGQLRDPTPWHFNAAFSTTSDGVGKFYHSHLMTDKLLHSQTRYNWTAGKDQLMGPGARG